MRSRLFALTAVGFGALLSGSGGRLDAQLRPAAQPMALVGGTVYVDPAKDPIRDGAVLIRNGAIAAVGPRASLQIPQDVEILDCSGLTIAAGFWNSHVHLTERKWANASNIPAAELTGQLQEMLSRYGFTSVFDTGSMWDNTRRIRDRIEAGEIPGPYIRSTGEILFPKGGAPPDLILDVLGTMRVKLPEVADAAEALAAATPLLDAGADGIKIYAATWAPPIVFFPEDAIRAVAAETHRRGKLVFAHPSNTTALMAAVRGGVDIVVHTTPQSAVWDQATVDAMKKANIALIPTLKLWRYEGRHDRASAVERFARHGVDQLRAWLAVGGTVLFGTDVGYMSDYDTSDEYALLSEAGMNVRQILASLTTAPAARFGDAERRGRVAPGFAADLVILDDDPARDIRAFAAVRYTIRNGTVIYRRN